MGAGPDAVARAYRAFWSPAPSSLGVCTACCMDPAMERQMRRKEPQDLSLAEVREWLDAAYSDDSRAILWIVPRILDLLLEGKEVSSLGNEVALARLPRAGFPGAFTPAQVTAVQDICLLVLEAKVPQDRPELDNTLCMIASSGLDMQPFLDALDALTDAELARMLHAEWFWGRNPAIWRTAFWQDQPGRRQVWHWYTGAALEDRMMHAGFAGDPKAEAVFDLLSTYGPDEPTF